MGIIDYVGNNSAPIDAVECETKLRSKTPKLLLPNERIILAFKGRGGAGRDKTMLTSDRVIIQDKKGLTGKCVGYISVPYTSIAAYSVDTCGTFDTDSALKIHARGIGKVSIDFVKSVDVLAIFRFLSSVVIQGKVAGELVSMGAIVHDPNASGGGGGVGGIIDIFGSNYSQVDKNAIESRLKNNPNILLPEERVDMAFKCGRDSLVLTSHRVLRIDVQGISGKKVEYITILWPHIKGYSIETAGNILDRDSELVLYFNLPDTDCAIEGCPRKSRTRMRIDFRSGQVDLLAVQRYISDKLLGPDTAPAATSQYSGNSTGGHVNNGPGASLSSKAGFLAAFLGDDNRMIDPNQANHQFHTEQPILQGCENVELAFKGRRDMLLFTTKRVIFIDFQGIMGIGKKTEYTSLPYSTITAFSVRSAGSWADKDSELCLWLDFDDVFYPPRDNDDDPPPPPIPRKSYLEIDFQKDKVDILVVHRYLSERMMRTNGHTMKPYTSNVSSNLLVPSLPGTGEKLLNWIGENAAAIDANSVNQKFKEAGILQQDEKVAFAFKTGRDSLYLTNKRFFMIDVQGFSGKRKEFMSVPWDLVKVWSVESAGGAFDRDMELRLWFKGSWNNHIKQDLRKGTADLFAIQSFISHFVIGSADGATALSNAQSYVTTPSGAATKLLGFLNDAHMKNAAEVTSTLRSSPALLQPDESIEVAYKCGRDLFLISTKRMIIIDKKGLTGKSVEYTSYPLSTTRAFMIETEGSLLNGPEFKIYTDHGGIKQELAKGQKDNVWLIHEMLSNKMLTGRQNGMGAVTQQLASMSVVPQQRIASYQPQPVVSAPTAAYTPYSSQSSAPASTAAAPYTPYQSAVSASAEAYTPYSSQTSAPVSTASTYQSYVPAPVSTYQPYVPPAAATSTYQPYVAPAAAAAPYHSAVSAYSSASAPSKPIAEYTSQEVGTWLSAQGLGYLVSKFHSAGVNGDVLVSLDADDFKNDFGLSDFEVTKILSSIN